MNIKIIDTETASLKGTILEVGTVTVDNNLKFISEETDLIRPPDGTVLSYEAMAVNNITPEMLEGKPTFTEVQDEYNGADVYVAHNKSFDQKVLTKEDHTFGDKQWVCTLQLARKIYPDSPSHKLMVLFYYLGIYKTFNYEGEAHRALFDVHVTYALLQHMMQTQKVNTLEDLLESTKVDVAKEKCTFGKHRGKTWEWILENDLSYCRWVVANALKKGNEQVVREWLTEKIN